MNKQQNEMPIGLGMALAMNPEAMQKFASLPVNTPDFAENPLK